MLVERFRQICWHSCLLTYRPSFRSMQYGAQYQDLDEHFRQTTVELTTYQIVPSLERFFTHGNLFLYFTVISHLFFSSSQVARFTTLLQCLSSYGYLQFHSLIYAEDQSFCFIYVIIKPYSSLRFHKEHSSVTVTLPANSLLMCGHQHTVQPSPKSTFSFYHQVQVTPEVTLLRMY